MTVYPISSKLLHIQILIINQPFGNWTSRKIGPTPTNTPIPNAETNCGTKTLQNTSTVSKTELKCFNLVWNKIIPHTETTEITFARIDTNAQQKKEKKKRKGIIDVGWDIPQY